MRPTLNPKLTRPKFGFAHTSKGTAATNVVFDPGQHSRGCGSALSSIVHAHQNSDSRPWCTTPCDSAELPPRTFCTFLRELSSRRQHTPTDARILLEELSGLSERPMIIRMTTASRPQQRYDHRLRDLVQRTGDLTIATDLGVPRSTARGWLRATPTIVVTLEVADLTEQELRQELRKLRRRVEKLAALLRLALALLHTSGFTLSGERLPDGHAKLRILRAVDRAHACIPLRAILRFLRVSPSRFQAWRRRQAACALDDRSSCPHTSPHRLTPREVRTIKDMVIALEDPTRPDRHARRPRAAARHGLRLALDLVPPRTEVRLATPPAPRASGEAEGGAPHDAS